MKEQDKEEECIEFVHIFNKEFEHDEPGMSQEVLCMYDHLCELLKYFETPSALKFLKSNEARKENSKARSLVESGLGWAKEMKEEDLAIVIYAAIILGGTTLAIYLKVMED